MGNQEGVDRFTYGAQYILHHPASEVDLHQLQPRDILSSTGINMHIGS
jgi:hypothetical protein